MLRMIVASSAFLLMTVSVAQAIDRQTECIARAVYWEARGLSEEGMKAVAEVVHNRVNHPRFPKTPCAVVHQRSNAVCQFSWTCGPLKHRIPPNNAAWRTSLAVANSPPGNLTNGALYFHARKYRARWRHLDQIAEIDEHVFYRERK
jgi:spore germination cell wall hydrolase CwlJ-like protein